MSTIDISNMDKAEVLCKLFNASKPQNMGFLQSHEYDMTIEEAQKLLIPYSERIIFDYIRGRVMKVDLSDDSFDPRAYDRDNGEGAAAEALGLT